MERVFACLFFVLFFFMYEKMHGVRPHSTGVKPCVYLYIFALTSMSLGVKDFLFLKEMIGGSLKIWRSNGCLL